MLSLIRGTPRSTVHAKMFASQNYRKYREVTSLAAKIYPREFFSSQEYKYGTLLTVLSLCHFGLRSYR